MDFGGLFYRILDGFWMDLGWILDRLFERILDGF